MRILQIGKFYPPPYGGIETVVATLVHELRHDVETDLVVANDKRRGEMIERDGYRVYKLPRLLQLAGTPICPTMPLLVRRLFRRSRHQLVHLHFPNPMAHLAAWVLPRDVPVVISWHSDIARQRRLLRLYQPSLRHLLARAAAVVAATPKSFSSSSQLDGCVDACRRFVVPYGLDTSRFSVHGRWQGSTERLRRRWPGKSLVFSIGRHVRYKGFEYLVRAMAGVDSAVLLLGGTGPLTSELKAAAHTAGVQNRVEFLGSVPEQELPLYYAAADVFCLPSV
ncbi:MAG TPA: glycosyltransferase, partial [Planctomycetaceae bacterium]|nr:glycosyltransferase [Planctomycetaceae bacterium]